MPTIDEVDADGWDALSTSDQDEIIDRVEDLSSVGWGNMSRSRKVRAVRDAISERDTIYSGRMSRTPTLDGDAAVFTRNLAAHKMENAEGGEAQSESGEGGSTSYNSSQGDGYLDSTRYGKTAKRHVRNDESIAIVRSW